MLGGLYQFLLKEAVECDRASVNGEKCDYLLLSGAFVCVDAEAYDEDDNPDDGRVVCRVEEKESGGSGS
jgi:hypothetical protein